MKDRKWVAKTLLGISLSGTVIVAGLIVFLYVSISQDLPEIENIKDYKPMLVSSVWAPDEDGKKVKVGEFYKERRYLIQVEDIPKQIINAFISAEDDQFYEHQGINLVSILRAAIANIKAGHVVQGGSTITQQVAKTLLLSPERSFLRKAKEIIISYKIEQNFQKNEILFLYLNQIYLGNGAYGIKAAAQQYFRKDINEITLAEAALLGGMPQAPGKYSPHLNPQKAKERQQYVLRRMLENGYITTEEHKFALSEEIKIHENEDINLKHSPHWVEEVRQKVISKYGEKKLFEEGVDITITGTYKQVISGQRSLINGLKIIDKRSGYRGPLNKIKSESEIQSWIDAQKEKLVRTELGYRNFTADGNLEYNSLINQNILSVGKSYPMVVTATADSGKVAMVNIAGLNGEISNQGLDWARKSLSKGQQLFSRGDVVLGKIVSQTESSFVAELDQEPQVQAALYSIDVKTGKVLALVGGYDFEKSKFNRVFQAKRQPGSSYKPIIFAAGLENGFTPATIIVDAPIVYEDEDTGKWKPTNFEEKFYGDTTFRQALVKSRNVPTIKIVQQVTVPKLIEFSKRIGMIADYPNDLSISLGSAAVTLAEMTRVYSVFPRHGKMVDPYFIESIHASDGSVIEKANPDLAPDPATVTQIPGSEDARQVLDPRVAYVMTHLMKEVVTYGTGHAAQTLGRVSAGKTGTTNDYNDAWYIGFTPDVVSGVWVGFDVQKSIGASETGAKAALPIWLEFMQEAVKSYPESDFAVPPGVVFSMIHPETGAPVSSHSANGIREAFVAGTEPEVKNLTNPSSQPSQKGFLKEDF